MPIALLIGATGPAGRAIIHAASGMRLRALARQPDKLADLNVEVVRGDVRDPASLVRAMEGVDTVVSVLGTPLVLKGKVTLLSEGTRNILAAMRQAGVERFLCVTGMGAGDSKGHGGWLYDHILLPALLGRIYADKERQEAAVMASDADWVLIRPAMLTNTPATGKWREITPQDWSHERAMSKISREDVARFIVQEVQEHSYSRQCVNISY